MYFVIGPAFRSAATIFLNSSEHDELCSRLFVCLPCIAVLSSHKGRYDTCWLFIESSTEDLSILIWLFGGEICFLLFERGMDSMMDSMIRGSAPVL